MTQRVPDPASDSLLRQRALSRWDNEGGATPSDPDIASIPTEGQIAMPSIGEAQLGALHVRIIALENLVIALLSGASERQLELALNMAPHIAPRPGYTPHPLTTRAADHIVELVERASRFRSDGWP